MAKDPQKVAEKWVANISSATTQAQIKEGIARVQESPMARAATREDAYLAGVQRALQTGKRSRGLARRSLSDWQRLTTAKVSRIAAGAMEEKNDMVKFFSELLPYTEQVKATIAQMPKGTEADGDARMMAAVNMMRKFKRS